MCANQLANSQVDLQRKYGAIITNVHTCLPLKAAIC